jgi:large subunit ribosomal protein L23
VRDPHTIILHPHITERSVRLSYGDPRVKDEAALARKYTFVVATDANKIEIKRALEAIYNSGRSKKDGLIMVESVRTVTVRGKMRRVGSRQKGKKPDTKKAIVTLAPGQVLEDYGV